VNIVAPLCPGIFLPRKDRSDIWISLKYERLPEVCFRCGIIGHMEYSCESEKILLSNEFGSKFPAFGEWLKTDNDKVPPGIYATPPVELLCVEPASIVPVTANVVGANSDEILLASKTKVVVEKGADVPNVVLSVPIKQRTVEVCASKTEVSSFATLLAHSLKDVSCSSRASESVLSRIAENRYVLPFNVDSNVEQYGPEPNPCLISPYSTPQNIISSPTHSTQLNHITPLALSPDHIQSTQLTSNSSCEAHLMTPLVTSVKPIEPLPTKDAVVALTPSIDSSLDLSKSPNIPSLPADQKLKRKAHPQSPESEPKN
jgi:hypothetical protein